MGGIAIFGGTFNPVHKGHTRLLETVLEAVEIEETFVIPARIPPHKEAPGLADGGDRLEMCRIAFEKYGGVRVSDYELKREGRSYSYYTVKHFKEKFPDKKLYFIMGSDMLLSFEKWYRWRELLGMCVPVCVSRRGEDTAAARERAKLLSSAGEAVFVESEPFEISSTQIRKMISDKNFTKLYCYLDENVVKYIMDKNLYG